MEPEQIIKRLEVLSTNRSNWESLWQDCGDYGMPQNNQITAKKAEGERSNDLFDTTAEDSNIQLAAAQYSYLFPTDSRAFVLKVDDNKLSKVDEVKNWLEEMTRIIHLKLVQSNFRQAFFGFLKSLGCYGTACMYIEKGKKKPLNFVNYHMSEIFIDLNSEGDVDTVYRPYEYTARQAVQEFGEDALKGTPVLEAAESVGNQNKKFEFIHAVYPRTDFDDSKDDSVNMPWVSHYVLKVGKVTISESGYEEMPYMVDFFDKDARETYGRSPMMKKLPDIKMVNRMQKTRIKGWEKATDPPIVVPDDGSIWPLATQPGGVLFKRAGSDDPTWFEFKGNMRDMEEAIKSIQGSIRTGFFLDMFDPLIDRKNMTATETIARIDQTMRFLTPMIGRRQSGFSNPMITRVIGILSRSNRENEQLPEQPGELVDAEYSIEYLGKLALVLKTLESEGLAKLLANWAPLGEVDSSFMDNLDTDEAFRDDARNSGVPASWLKTIDKRDEDRAKKAQQLLSQQMAEQLPDLTKSVKNVSQAPEEGSLVKEMLNDAA